MRRSVVLATITLSIWFSSATAGVENAKIAFHVQAHTSKSVCAAAPTIPCFQYVTRGDVGVSYDVYLVVADATTDVGGLSCGIAYNANPSQGVDVYSWSFCGDGIEFPHEGPNGPWPSSESGTRLTWTDVSLTVFNISGMKVRTLVRDALDAGPQEATWNGRDDAGRRVTPGIYVVRLRTPGFVASRCLLLMP